MQAVESVSEGVKAKTNANISWGPVWAIALSIIIYFAAQIIGLLLVMVYPMAQGWQQGTITKWLETSVNAQFATVLLTEIITIGALALFLKWRKSNFKSLGLGKIKIKWLGYALFGYVTYFIILLLGFAIAKQLLPSLDLDQKQQLGFDAAHQPYQLVLVFMSLVILPAFVEELMTRGFLYQGLKKKWPKWLAVIVTSLIFGMAHLQFGLDAPLLWAAAIDTFILSLVLIALVERSGSLWPAIGLHFIKNSLAFTFLFLVN